MQLQKSYKKAIVGNFVPDLLLRLESGMKICECKTGKKKVIFGMCDSFKKITFD